MSTNAHCFISPGICTWCDQQPQLETSELAMFQALANETFSPQWQHLDRGLGVKMTHLKQLAMENFWDSNTSRGCTKPAVPWRSKSTDLSNLSGRLRLRKVCKSPTAAAVAMPASRLGSIGSGADFPGSTGSESQMWHFNELRTCMTCMTLMACMTFLCDILIQLVDFCWFPHSDAFSSDMVRKRLLVSLVESRNVQPLNRSSGSGQ